METAHTTNRKKPLSRSRDSRNLKGNRADKSRPMATPRHHAATATTLPHTSAATVTTAAPRYTHALRDRNQARHAMNDATRCKPNRLLKATTMNATFFPVQI